MREYVIYNNKKYFIQTSGRYYQSGLKTDKERLLHRAVWSDHYGDIPKGYIIHHKDHNWRNNNISNLELVELRKHLSDHAKESFKNPDYVEKTSKGLIKAREAAKTWHSSRDGIEWHRQHSLESWKDRKLFTIKCIVCYQDHLTPFPSRTIFCSRSCEQKHSYQRHKTESRQCLFCKKEFIINKFKKTLTCSRSCGAKMRWQNNKS